MRDFGKKNLLGIGVNAVDYEAAIATILACAHAGETCATSALAVHGLVLGALDAHHKYRLNRFRLILPDGQPVRWALNLLHGTSLTERVYGPKLMLKVCDEAAKQGVPVYFFGSTQTVVDMLTQRMRSLCPGLRITGARPSQFRTLNPVEHAALLTSIQDSGARILFVGLGCPRQEISAYEMAPRLSMPILAVGAAFDYHAGVIKEPPEFVQAHGLQWLYRLLQEPRRLFRRYLVTNTQFLFLLIGQRLGLWRPNIGRAQQPSKDILYG